MESSQYQNELLKCVRCGSCKALCPTYDEDATEPMGARGRLALLRALSSGQLNPSPALIDRIFSCMICGACSELCPTKIDIKEVLYHGRSLLKDTVKKRRILRFVSRFSAKKPKLSLRILNATKHIVLPYLLKKGFIPFNTDLSEQAQKEDELHVYTVYKKKGRIAVFTGCAVNFLYPHLRESLINVLSKLGYEVVIPVGEVCCGIPLRTLGLEQEAVELARKNIRIFNKLNVDAVLSLCPACTSAITTEYPKLAGEGISKAMDISSFFIDKLAPFKLALLSPGKSAIYHAPCHLKYGLGIGNEPKKIIGRIGIDLIEQGDEKCCGFAGTFSFSYKDLSQRLLNKCITEYIKTGAEMIITSCPGCMMQLSKGIKNKPVLHLIEVLEEAMFQNSEELDSAVSHKQALHHY